VVGSCSLLGWYAPEGWGNSALVLVYLWQDLSLDANPRLGGYVGVTHFLFYRLFIYETVGLNLYLFVGLVVTLVVLSFRYLSIDGVGHLTHAQHNVQTADRLRVVAKFRRQTRRTNSTRLRTFQ